ncbi:hypothetical protein AB0K16_22175 [Nonomuraea jabiensis]|uniref:hypothetical protein n=1 Tax=Nonomuraea jabiensis TaxID=882448 RepID=UPI003421E189
MKLENLIAVGKSAEAIRLADIVRTSPLRRTYGYPLEERKTAMTRTPMDKWLVKSASGEEIAIVDGRTAEDVQEEMRENYGMNGGYFIRRFTQEEYDARVIKVDPVTTPELYY